MKKIFFLLIFSIFVFNSVCTENKESGKMIGVYGFNRNADICKGLSAEQIADYIAGAGINGVWAKFKEESIPAALQKKDIKTFFEYSIFVGKKIWNDILDSRPILSNGEFLKEEGWYAGVCPSNDKVRQMKLKEIDRMFSKGFYDGVWLDFIRYPCHWEVKEPNIYESCFCNNCIDKFQKETEIKIPDNLNNTEETAGWVLDNSENIWREWKCEQITSFCANVRKLVDEKYPGKTVGLFGVPWRLVDFDRAIKKIICQDYKKLAEYIDVFSPMSYHLMCNRDVDWIGDVTKEIIELTKKPVWVIVQGVSEPVKMTDEEFEKAVIKGLSDGSSGVFVFSFDHMIKEDKWDVFLKIIKDVEK